LHLDDKIYTIKLSSNFTNFRTTIVKLYLTSSKSKNIASNNVLLSYNDVRLSNDVVSVNNNVSSHRKLEQSTINSNKRIKQLA